MKAENEMKVIIERKRVECDECRNVKPIALFIKEQNEEWIAIRKDMDDILNEINKQKKILETINKRV